MKLENLFFIFVLIILNTITAIAGPNRTTYQAKIIKPDGYPLEAANVNFKFTILDPGGVCILYSETYSSVNMTGTGGLISFALGSGVKTFPVSATTFENVFSNITPSITCDAGGSPSYSPLADDSRKVVMQFHDGAGWQTLPAMAINAVPYAMYANETQKLNGKTDADFVQVSTLPMTCGASEALRFNGAAFSCIAVGSGGVAVTSGSVITALGYTPADGASITTLASNLGTTNSNVSTISSSVSTLASGLFSVSTTVTSLSTSVTSLTTVVSGLQASVASLTTVVNNHGVSISALASDFAAISATANGALVTANSAVSAANAASATANTALAAANSVSSSVSALASTVSNKITSSAASIAQVLGYVPAASGGISSQWSTSGTTVNYLTGRVGVGTVNPEAQLAVEVTDVGNHASALLLRNASNIQNTGVALDFSADADYLGARIVLNRDQQAGPRNSLRFYVNGSVGAANNDDLVIQDSGNVGFGTSNPTRRLHVNENTATSTYAKFTNGAAPTNGLDVGINSAGQGVLYQRENNDLVIGTSDTQRMIIKNSGLIGIGLTSPMTTLDVSGAIRIGMDAVTCSAGYAGSIRYNAGLVEYCNGTTWSAFGVAGAGITNLNGSASGSQTFANGIAGTQPAYISLNGVHTLNIPYAASAGVTAGLLSYADYTSFAGKADAASVTALSSNLNTVSATATNALNTANSVSSSVNSLASTVANKITSSAASIEAVLGYVPAASGSAINSQWVTSGSAIHYITGNVGIGTASATRRLEVWGGAAVAAFNGSASNHGYLELYTDMNNPTSRTGYVGFPTSGSRVLNVYSQYASGVVQLQNSGGYLQLSHTGNVGIGVPTPATKLSVSGGLQIGLESSACAAGLAGTLRYNGGVVEYCNGTTWSAFGVAGAGLTLLNGSASNTQTFANGISGLQPAFTTLNGVHTLNIPFAASAGVTAGLLSNADYSSFAAKASAASLTALSSTVSNLSTSMSSLSSDLAAVSATAMNALNTANAVSSSVNSLASTVANKITSSAAAIEQVLGYLPAASGSSVSSQWVTSGTGIHYIAGNVGIGSTNPTSPLHVLGSSTSSSTPWATFEGGGAVSDNIALRLFDRGTGAGNNNILEFAHSINGSATPAGTSRIRSVNVGGNAASGSSMFFETASDSAGTWNSNQFVLNRNGNVGVGTATPGTKLHAEGAFDGEQAIKISNTSASGSAYAALTAVSDGNGINIEAYSTGATGVWGTVPKADSVVIRSHNGAPPSSMLIGTSTGVPLYLMTAGAPRVSLDSSGNLGVGLVSSSAKIHIVAGSTSVAPIKFSSGSLLTSPQSGSIEYDGFDLYFTDGAGTRRALASESAPGTLDTSNINSTGNITMTPTGSVIVSSTTASTNSQTGALIVKGGLGIAGNTYSSGTILTSSNIEGNGIKTKGTTAYLEMHDTDTLYSANPQSALVFRDGGNSQYSFIGPSNGSMIWNSFLPIELDTSAGTDLYVSTSGRVGIGTSAPTGLLSIAGTGATDLRMESSNSGGSAIRLLAQNGLTYLQSGVSFGAASGADMRFTSMMGASTWMTLQASSGYVGIGTTNPQVGLHIQKGDANGASVFVQKDASSNGITFGTHAGSNRGYIQGSNSTNTALSELMLNPYGNAVGINVTSATARLHIASGTASLAPMKLTSGVLLTTAQAGAIEYNGFDLYFTDGAGTRRAIATEANPGVLDASTINSSGNITMTPTGSVIVSSTTASANYTNGSLIVNGGAGVAGALNVNGAIATSSSVTLYNAGSINLQAAAGTPNDPGDIVFRNADGTERSRIYSGTTASGTLVFATGPAASTKMTILESGTVGIGTTTPLAALEVVRIDPVVRIKNSGGDAGGMYFQNSANSAFFGMYNPGGSSFGVVATNTSKAFLGFDSAGRMGSVTNTFTTGAPGAAAFRSVLDDGNGNMGVASAAPGARLAVKGAGATSATIALAVTDSSNNPNLILSNDGNLGLGILAPVAPLHMYGAADTANGNILIQNFQGGSQRMLKFAVGAKPAVNGFTTDDETASITAGGGSDMNLAFGTRNAETMRIDKNGNLGIGTTAPETILDVYQAASPTLRIRSASNDTSSGPVIRLVEDLTGNGALVRYHSVNNALELGVSESGVDNIPFTIGRSTGRIGIGGVTSATARLHIAAGNASAAPLKLTSGTLVPVAQAGSIEYDGFNFYITDGTGTRRSIASDSTPGTVDATNINSAGNITMTPTGSVVVSSTTASTNSTTGALVVKGGLGVAGNIFASGTIITTSNIQGASITATSGMIAPYIAGGTGSGNNITIDSTTHGTKGNILLAPNGGNVGLAMNPAGGYKFSISGSQKIDAGAGWARLSLGKTGFNGADIGLSSGTSTFLNNTESAGDLVVSNHGNMIFGNNSSLRTDMYIKASNGYVAIGATSAPTSKLHVYDDVNGLMTTRVHNTNAGSIAASRLQMGPGAAGNTTDLFITNYGAGYSTGTVLGLLTPANWVEIGTSGGSKGMAIGSSASAPIVLITNTTERLRVDSVGRVGIGTSNPVGTFSVVDAGVPGIQMKTAGAAAVDTFNMVNDMDATGNFWFAKGSANGVPTTANRLMNITNEGNFEIFGQQVNGTTDHSGILALKTQASGDGGTRNEVSMEFYADRTDLNTPSGYFGYESNTAFDLSLMNVKSGKLIFGTNNSAAMTMTASGNVGIGVTAPTQPLEVSTAATTFKTIAMTNTNSAGGAGASYQAGTNSLSIGTWGQTAGSVVTFIEANSSAGLKMSTWTNTAMTFHTNGSGGGNTERMRILNTGQVGIGTTAPGQALTVSGVIESTNGGFKFPDGTTQLSALNERTTDISAGLATNCPMAYDFGANFSASTGWTCYIDMNGLFSSTNGGNGQFATQVKWGYVYGQKSAFAIEDSADNSTWATLINNTNSGTFTLPSSTRRYVRFRSLDSSGFGNLSGVSVVGGPRGIAYGSYPTGWFMRETWRVASGGVFVGPGNVGVGTTNPMYKFVVSGGASVIAANGSEFWTERPDSDFDFRQAPSAAKRTLSIHAGQNATDVLTIYGNQAGTFNMALRINNANNYIGLGMSGGAYPVEASGTVNVANGGVLRFGGTQVCSSAGCTAVSDGRLKENVQPLDFSVEKLLALRPVQYDWINKEKFGSQHEIGFIAQELEKHFPEVVRTDSVTGGKSVAYDKLMAPVIQALQVFNKRIAELFDRSEKQQRQIASVEQENAALKARVEKTEKENAELKERLDRIEKALLEKK